MEELPVDHVMNVDSPGGNKEEQPLTVDVELNMPSYVDPNAIKENIDWLSFFILTN